MKRKLFIGSSSEGLTVAKALKDYVDSTCNDWIETTIWNEGGIFALNKNALDSLVKASRKFDYGVLIATADDIVNTRGVDKAKPRDNVILEIGMFLGSLGLTRAFLMVEEEAGLPSDYNGVTIPFFQKGVAGSLEKAIEKVVTSINNTRNSYNLKPVPSAALAMGYFDSFIQPLAKEKHSQNVEFNVQIIIPKNIKDIQSEKQAYFNANKSAEKSIKQDGSRPFAFEFVDKEHHYWDFPTTLSTLGKLMDLLIPSAEIGVDAEKQDWIEHELRNFKGTIEVLVEQCAACKGRVEILRMS